MRTLIIAAAMLAAPAAAEQPTAYLKQRVPQVVTQCGPRDAVRETLTRRWGEVRKGHAFAPAGGTFVEFWASPGGTWTVTETTPAGITCVIRAGVNWHMRPGVGS